MEFKKIQFLIRSIAKAKLLVVEKLLGKCSSCVSILSTFLNKKEFFKSLSKEMITEIFDQKYRWSLKRFSF